MVRQCTACAHTPRQCTHLVALSYQQFSNNKTDNDFPIVQIERTTVNRSWHCILLARVRSCAIRKKLISRFLFHFSFDLVLYDANSISLSLLSDSHNLSFCCLSIHPSVGLAIRLSVRAHQYKVVLSAHASHSIHFQRFRFVAPTCSTRIAMPCNTPPFKVLLLRLVVMCVCMCLYRYFTRI